MKHIMDEAIRKFIDPAIPAWGTSEEEIDRPFWRVAEEGSDPALPDAILYALDVVAEDNALLTELLLTEAKIDGVYFCVQGGEKNRFTIEEYKQYIAPSDLKVLDRANQFSDLNVLHCCGWAGIPNNLEVWQDYPAKAINWACFIENMDLREGKKFFGGKCVRGGFDNRRNGLLVSGEKDEIQAYARRLMAKAGRCGVMIGADCTLPGDIDIARIQWVVDAVKAANE